MSVCVLLLLLLWAQAVGERDAAKAAFARLCEEKEALETEQFKLTRPLARPAPALAEQRSCGVCRRARSQAPPSSLSVHTTSRVG